MQYINSDLRNPPKYAALAAGICLAASLYCLNAPVHAEAATPAAKPATATANAAAANPAERAMLQALMEKSGTNTSLDTIPAHIKMSIDTALKQAPKNPGAEQMRRLYTVVDKAYAPEKIKTMMLERLAGKIPPEVGKKVLVFLDSSLGKRVTKEEKSLDDPKIFAKVQANAAKLIAELGNNTTRMALYRSLDQALGLTQKSVKDFISTAMAVNAALLSGQFEAQNKPTLQQIQKNLEAQRFAITSMMSQVMLSSMAYVYRDLSEKDLNDYLQFALSPEGKIFFSEFSAALSEVMMDCAYESGKLAQPEQPPI